MIFHLLGFSLVSNVVLLTFVEIALTPLLLWMDKNVSSKWPKSYNLLVPYHYCFSFHKMLFLPGKHFMRETEHSGFYVQVIFLNQALKIITVSLNQCRSHTPIFCKPSNSCKDPYNMLIHTLCTNDMEKKKRKQKQVGTLHRQNLHISTQDIKEFWSTDQSFASIFSIKYRITVGFSGKELLLFFLRHFLLTFLAPHELSWIRKWFSYSNCMTFLRNNIWHPLFYQSCVPVAVARPLGWGPRFCLF